MERLDFEKKFKAAFDDYEINPSAKSWDKLQSGLDKQEKQPKRYLLWAGIAASILGGILISSLVFNKEPGVQEINVVNSSPNIEIRSGEAKKEEEQKFILNKKNTVRSSKISRKINLSNEKERTLVEAENYQTEPEENHAHRKKLNSVSNEKKSKIFSFTAPKLYAGISSEEMKLYKVSEAEIDRLLEEAQRSLPPNKYENLHNKITAEALLEGVETELNRSFRDKILNTLEEKLVEFALASRNN